MWAHRLWARWSCRHPWVRWWRWSLFRFLWSRIGAVPKTWRRRLPCHLTRKWFPHPSLAETRVQSHINTRQKDHKTSVLLLAINIILLLLRQSHLRGRPRAWRSCPEWLLGWSRTAHGWLREAELCSTPDLRPQTHGSYAQYPNAQHTHTHEKKIIQRHNINTFYTCTVPVMMEANTKRPPRTKE